MTGDEEAVTELEFGTQSNADFQLRNLNFVFQPHELLISVVIPYPTLPLMFWSQVCHLLRPLKTSTLSLLHVQCDRSW